MPRGIPKNPRAARVEGAVSPVADANDASAAAALRAPIATPEHDALTVIVEQFKREQPAEWEACRLWPTQSGIIHMIEVLSR